MLSRLVVARGSSGRSLLAACCFGLQAKSHLPKLVDSFRACRMVRRVSSPSAAPVCLCRCPRNTEDNRSWKSPFQSQFSATNPSTLLWFVEGQTIPCLRGNKREIQGGHISSSQNLLSTRPGPGPAARGQQLRVSPCSATMQHPRQDLLGAVMRVQPCHATNRSRTGWWSR